MTAARLEYQDQRRVAEWVRTRFDGPTLTDRRERAMRVLEEAMELAQAEGLGKMDAARLSEVVFSRPVGDPDQEAAGTAVTLLAWAAAANRSLIDLIHHEVARIYALPIDHFRKRQAQKIDLGVARHEI